MGQEIEPESLDHVLAEICRLLHRRAHALLEEIGLYRGQPPALRALWREEGLTHSELAELLHVKPPTITNMIQRMERAGLVRRRQDPEDERVSRVYLTHAGRAIQDDVQRVLGELGEEAFAGFTLEERVLFRRLLLQIRDNLLGTNGRK